MSWCYVHCMYFIYSLYSLYTSQNDENQESCTVDEQMLGTLIDCSCCEMCHVRHLAHFHLFPLRTIHKGRPAYLGEGA